MYYPIRRAGGDRPSEYTRGALPGALLPDSLYQSTFARLALIHAVIHWVSLLDYPSLLLATLITTAHRHMLVSQSVVYFSHCRVVALALLHMLSVCL